MKALIALLFAITLVTPAYASDQPDAEPIHHFKLADLTSAADAKRIFIEKTAEMKSKTNLDAAALHEIHIITYTLEKSVEFFTQNLTGNQQAQAKALAIVVEDIHLSSENNQTDKTQQHLNQYFQLADKFIAALSEA